MANGHLPLLKHSMQKIHTTHNVSETIEVGKQLAGSLQAGAVVALFGQLGSGKTCLTKGIGQGLGVKSYITSPTFTIMHQYHGRLPVYHFDLYRLSNADELYDIGFEEYLNGDGVCIVEWAEKCLPLLPFNRIEITLEALNEHDRQIIINQQ
jgi:tRNA threonylcarbamoyladenosine biosynthesis protein TsaE